MSTRELRCPPCDGRMNPVERRGVVIDLCRDCTGIFLDRGNWTGCSTPLKLSRRHWPPRPIASAAFPGRRAITMTTTIGRAGTVAVDAASAVGSWVDLFDFD